LTHALVLATMLLAIAFYDTFTKKVFINKLPKTELKIIANVFGATLPKMLQI